MTALIIQLNAPLIKMYVYTFVTRYTHTRARDFFLQSTLLMPVPLVTYCNTKAKRARRRFFWCTHYYLRVHCACTKHSSRKSLARKCIFRESVFIYIHTDATKREDEALCNCGNYAGPRMYVRTPMCYTGIE